MKTQNLESTFDENSKTTKWLDGRWRETDSDQLTTTKYINKAKKLIKRSKIAVFIYLDPDGMPVGKAMLVADRVNFTRLYFSTNSSSKHVNQVTHNPVATLYIYDPKTIEGLMLSGKAVIEADPEWRKRIWRDSYAKFYSGLDDPDYCVLRFDVDMCNYYHLATNVTFRM
ncbi:MAG: pyridoxamine 5'-phosphate oxidase family protein [Paludibacter sp.]|nr:pyridoxamine 5'-phosphate oxidase family protein [Paludibacter sp.]MDD4198941.1 pyridoxamine 5'-phosphate oxidase family protein [Paludibacter sp.]MDD4428202.1 pyridoxamine 5'-phosphate oxidase family protein [Paludibacter sp.]